ncbi:MAG: hypothetical protein AAFU56_05720 [Pseudomonadota bacterium]
MLKPMIVAAALLSASITAAAAQEVYSGKFSDGLPVSLSIVSKSPLRVRYCYNEYCWNMTPEGTVNSMTLRWEANSTFPGATMTIDYVRGRYVGFYQQTGSQQYSETVLTRQ